MGNPDIRVVVTNETSNPIPVILTNSNPPSTSSKKYFTITSATVGDLFEAPANTAWRVVVVRAKGSNGTDFRLMVGACEFRCDGNDLHLQKEIFLVSHEKITVLPSRVPDIYIQLMEL